MDLKHQQSRRKDAFEHGNVVMEKNGKNKLERFKTIKKSE